MITEFSARYYGSKVIKKCVGCVFNASTIWDCVLLCRRYKSKLKDVKNE